MQNANSYLKTQDQQRSQSMSFKSRMQVSDMKRQYDTKIVFFQGKKKCKTLILKIKSPKRNYNIFETNWQFETA